MEAYPIKLSYHVRDYYFGERLIPELLGKADAPDGVVAEFPDELVGESWRGPHFPILLKFLDASHMLPVHLHADDETAREKHGEPHGKTEAWHILWAEPGATILAGIKDGLSREDLFDAFKRQDYGSVMPRYEIRAGDTVYVPGGIL